jgi:hypothetical protein
MRLMVEVGTGCAKLHDEQMRNLTCRRIQCDEIWSYVKVEQANIAKGQSRTRIGDQWTFVAIDPDTKLIPAYLIASARATTLWISCSICGTGFPTASRFHWTRSAPTWTRLSGHSAQMWTTGR